MLASTVRHRLAATSDAPARARRLVADALSCEGACLEAAQLAVSELVTNALHHGRVRPDAGHIELRLEPRGKRLRVNVLDPGAGGQLRRRRAGRDGGWGLAIVDRVAHAWGHGREDGRTLVWFEV
jgi:anti-sigma regulatory factor (Ser/Thr protein kinase)